MWKSNCRVFGQISPSARKSGANAYLWRFVDNFVSDPRYMLFAVIMLASCVITGTWGANLWVGYQSEKALAHAKALESARLFQDHFTRNIKLATVLLERVSRTVRAVGLRTFPHSFEQGGFDEQARLIPGHKALWLFDANGQRLDLKLAANDGMRGAYDTEFFRAHRDEGLEATIGPLEDDGNGRRFFVSRRLAGRDGAFAGVALAVFDARYEPDFFKALDLGPQAAAVLLRQDGALLWRLPHMTGPWPGLADGPSYDLAAGKDGEPMTTRSPIDGRVRLTVMQPFDGLPLVAVSGIAIDHAFAGWRMAVFRWSPIVVALFAALAVFGCLALRAMGAEKVAQQRLAAANLKLEDDVRDRTREAMLQKRQAERESRAKSRILAAASHDLRQPLQAARLYLEVLKGHIDQPRQHEIVAEVVKAVEAGGGLLSALVDVSSLEAGLVAPSIETLPAASILAALSGRWSAVAAEKNLRLKVMPCQAMIQSDPVLLGRLLDKLVENAVNFTTTGGVVVGCRRIPGFLRIEVWDSGIGIGDDHLDMIFEDFYQVANPQRDRNHGLGLGLSVAERAARLLGHRLDVRSRPGKGTVFSVLVPLAL